jgi:hypothetical protein
LCKLHKTEWPGAETASVAPAETTCAGRSGHPRTVPPWRPPGATDGCGPAQRVGVTEIG